jgi:5-methylcytosine-specific restriction enzyme subunit McrC
LRQTGVSQKHKQELKKIMLFFDGVDEIDVLQIRWDMLKFQRNNQTYKMLLNICYFVLNGLLYSDEKGIYKVANFLDEQRMSSLYEKFILEYYKYHFKGILTVNSTQIDWDYDESQSIAIEFLPKMQSDIMLTHKESGKTLIIDAKYYTHSMQTGQFNKKTFHSNNMYQIFTYVKNYDTKNDGSVSGMLLYAKTDDEVNPDGEFIMSGNKISVKTLDLNLDFKYISLQLNDIVSKEFLVNI